MEKALGYSFEFDRFSKCKYPVYADYREYQADHKHYVHRHDFSQIWYCYDRSYVHKIGDEIIHCPTGSLMVVPAGTMHDVIFDSPAKILCLNVSREILLRKSALGYKNAITHLFLGDFWSEVDPDRPECFQLSPDSRKIVEKVFSGFVLLGYEPHHPTDDKRFWQGLEDIFSLPEFSLPEQLMQKALHMVESRILPIFRMIDYLNDHYSEKVTDELLLQEGNISRAVMYRYFKRVLGTSYSNYLQKLRVRHAHLYMRSTTFHITQIARICGFYDVCHMTRAYNKFKGTTPSAERQRLRELYQNGKRGK